MMPKAGYALRAELVFTPHRRPVDVRMYDESAVSVDVSKQ